jgi:hypothetical protein
MSSESHPLSSLEQQLVDLLDEHARLGSHADDISSRVCLARAWLEELERELDQLNALTNPAPEQERQLRLLRLDIDHCKEIVTKHDALKRSCVRCIMVIPEDGAVFRVKSDEQRPKDVCIKKARFRPSRHALCGAIKRAYCNI